MAVIDAWLTMMKGSLAEYAIAFNIYIKINKMEALINFIGLL